MINLNLVAIEGHIDDCISIDIALKDSAFDGGVYMFLIDGVPLYIGQANIFIVRLTDHLYELKKNTTYFGLQDLAGKHTLTFMILEGNLPYNSGLETEYKIKRREMEIAYINEYYPLTQNPKPDIGKTETLQVKTDKMIMDTKEKNRMVKKGLDNLCYYEQIIEKIKANLREK